MNRTLSRWSPSSLAAMTRQPARAARGRSRRRHRCLPRPRPGRRRERCGALIRGLRSARAAAAGRLRRFTPGALDRSDARRRCGRCRRATGRPAGARSGEGPCSTAATRMSCRTRPSASPAGRGPATCRCPPAAPRRTRPTRSPRSVVPARSTSAGVGSSRPTSMIARPVTELRGQLVDRADADEAAGGEDPDPVADRLDLAEQVARRA